MGPRLRVGMVYAGALTLTAVIGYVVPVWAWRRPDPARTVATVPATDRPALSPIPAASAAAPLLDGPESSQLKALRAGVVSDVGQVRHPDAPAPVADAPDTAAEATTDAAKADWLVPLDRPALPVRADRRTLANVRYFTQNEDGRKTFRSWLKRRGRYRSIVLSALREQLLPDDLEAVALLESGMSPAATSGVGAVGLWQLMPDTARAYGLAVESGYDERRSVIASTRAAAKHLADLYEKFGSWDLALAAYDMGYPALLRRIRELASNDYWTMTSIRGALPDEAASYVPKVFAISIILHNLAHFGMNDVVADPPFSAVALEVEPGTPLGVVARAAGTSVRHLRDLNPEILTTIVPDRTRMVMIPPEGRARALSMLPRLLSDRDNLETTTGPSFDWGKDELPTSGHGKEDWEGLESSDGPKPFIYYRVGEKETLEAIAEAFGVTPAAIVKLNRLDPDAKLQRGMMLKLRASQAALARIAGKRADARLAEDRADSYTSSQPQPPGNKPEGTTTRARSKKR